MKPNLFFLVAALAGLPAHAAVLVTYLPTGSAASSPNNAPINASTVAPLVAASAIGDIAINATAQLGSGSSGPVRTANGTWTFGTGGWLFANSLTDGINGTATSTADYFSFSLSTPGFETLALESLTFDYGVGTNATGQIGTFHYALFASVNNGAFTQFGSTFSTGSLTLAQNATNLLGNQSINLSSITGAETVAFRVWVGSTIGFGTTGSIFRNVTVNGITIPEPSAALLGSFGMLVLLRRRRLA